MADANLRRLVENASQLEEAAVALSRRRPSHPSSPHIKNGKHYTTPSGKLWLPTTGEAVRRIDRALNERVLDVRADFGLIAAGRTLDQPTMVLPMTVHEDSLIAAGIPVPASWMSRVRRLALAKIFDLPAQANIPTYDSPRRLGGGVELTFLLDEDHARTLDCWVTFEWNYGTRGMATWLERQLAEVPAATLNSFLKRSLTVLVNRSLNDKVRSALVAEAVRISAAAFGLKGIILDLGEANFGQVASTLKGNPSSFVVAIGAHDEAMDALLGAASAAGSHALSLGPLADGDALHTLREALALLTSVGLELNAVPVPPQLPDDRPQRVPVSAAVECLHDRFERWYVREADTDLWWTVDTAGHAACKYKTYERVNRTLQHQADRDFEGKVIENKFKGEEGRHVEMSELHACPRPSSHIRPV